jgi:hypothetical protein
MALNSNALVTLAKMRIFLGIPVAVVDADLDTLIEDFINSASERCEIFCNRKFISQTHLELHDGDRTKQLIMHQWPVRSFSRVNFDSSGEFVAGDDEDNTGYFLFQDERGDSIGLQRKSGTFPRGEYNVLVEYLSGYDDITVGSPTLPIPADLAEACKIIVAYWYQINQNKDYTTAAKSKGDENVTIEKAIPRLAIEILEDYKRLEIPGTSIPLVQS